MKHLFSTMPYTAFCTVLTLAACSSQTVKNSAAVTEVEKAEVIKTSGMAPNGYSKPGASISMTHNYDGKTDSGANEVINVILSEAYDAGVLKLTMTTSDGLQLNSSSAREFQMADADSHEVSVNVSALQDGWHNIYLNASVEKDDGTTSFRAFAISVPVGENATAPKSKTETTASGEEMIMMEAEETIITDE